MSIHLSGQCDGFFDHYIAKRSEAEQSKAKQSQAQLSAAKRSKAKHRHHQIYEGAFFYYKQMYFIMKTSTFKIIGQSPILVVGDRLADPLDPATIEHKKLTSIRGKAKTTDVIIAIAKSQYVNAIYYDEKIGVYIPSINIKKCAEEGAKLSRNGDKIRKGFMIFEDKIKLDYGANLTPEQLWDSGEYLDKRSVVVSNSKVMCYRPKFPKWSLTFECTYDESIIEEKGILYYMTEAGSYVGLGGFRPAKNGMFGRFTVELLK